MRWREFITIFGGAATWPLEARAAVSADAADRRDDGQLRRVIGLRSLGSQRSGGALTKLGCTEGGNLRIEFHWTAGYADKMRTLAKELVDMRPNAVLGVTTARDRHTLAHETRQFRFCAFVSNPIGSGFVANLAHPGGHITGFQANGDAVLPGKWVQLLKEIAPHTSARRCCSIQQQPR